MFVDYLNQKVLIAKALALSSLLLTSCVQSNDIEGRKSSTNGQVQTVTAILSHQLNCTTNPGICSVVCDETKHIPWSSTFCDNETGSCICDCRDSIPKDCQKTPFTPCFQDCVRKNPNPDVYLYEGGNCPVSLRNGTKAHQCACECTQRDDYEEVNDII